MHVSGCEQFNESSSILYDILKRMFFNLFIFKYVEIIFFYFLKFIFNINMSK